jgi:vacuolar-type H+-ATPase subunit I/STV1
MVFSLILGLKHDIFGLFLIFKSQLFHNETVDGIQDTIDILSLLLGVVL